MPSSPPPMVFEVTKTIAAYTTAGLAPGGGLKVTVLPEAALQLQRSLGVKLFSALFTLICMAGDDGQRLVVDTNAAKLAEQLGCSRQKAGELVTQLEQAGFLDRQQARGIGGRADRFGRGRYVLCPDLYRAVERRQNLTHSERPLGVSSPDVTEPDTGSRATGVGKADTTPTAVSGPDTTSGTAGRAADRFSDTGARSHRHEDGMDENHSSPSATDERLTPPSVVAGLPAADVVALLEQWGVFDAEAVVRTADPAVLDAALREISGRFAEIKNPGAYLRRLLAGGGPVARASAPAAPPPPVPAAPVQTLLPMAQVAPVAPRPRTPHPAPPGLPDLTGEQLVEVYASLPDADRDEVDQALGRMAAVAGTGWCHVPGLSRTRRLYLVGVLERLGLLGAR